MHLKKIILLKTSEISRKEYEKYFLKMSYSRNLNIKKINLAFIKAKL